jgi:hypothetical protein
MKITEDMEVAMIDQNVIEIVQNIWEADPIH